MMDKTAEERRRLSAAWLNVVAAGLVSAGVVHGFAWVAAEGWDDRIVRLVALGAGYVLAGIGFHVLARALIPKPPAHNCPRSGDSS
jgi:hypothetical protein